MGRLAGSSSGLGWCEALLPRPIGMTSCRASQLYWNPWHEFHMVENIGRERMGRSVTAGTGHTASEQAACPLTIVAFAALTALPTRGLQARPEL